ncbi:hypothetical protein D8674_017595 [Pyrus ussuriensis x Pyrus communis]|uniref:Uncharacterized protein n=1 Tax=Pyrus ussuriensis x Pyrus communis TaxID=2448454 RepID=A0A5N5HDJ1_9ROSA|nr:hypothetical protein D8674_017595 [Pyrus ussuriensis x Pyrus communis]
MADSGVYSSKTTDSEGDGKALVCTRCVADWESRRAIPDELKMHLIDELVPNWDIDKNDPNLMKAIDNMFKQNYRKNQNYQRMSRIGFLILILLLI